MCQGWQRTIGTSPTGKRRSPLRSPSGCLAQERVDLRTLIRDELSGHRVAAGLTVVEDRLAVDDDPVDALRRHDAPPVTVRQVVANGVVVTLVPDRVVVVDVEIGGIAFDQGPAPVESKDPGGKLAHPEVRILKRQGPLLPHQPRDHLGRVMPPGEELDVGAAIRSARYAALVAGDLGVHCGILAEKLRRAEIGVETRLGDDFEEHIGDRPPGLRGDLANELAFELGVAARAVAPVQDERLERAARGHHCVRVVAFAHSRQVLGIARLGKLGLIVANAELAEDRDGVPQIPFSNSKLSPDSANQALAVDLQAAGLAAVEPFEAAWVEVRHGGEGGHQVADDRPAASTRQLLGDVAVVGDGAVAEDLDASLAPLPKRVGDRVGVLDRHGVRGHRRAVDVDMAVAVALMGKREADRAAVHRFVQHVLELLALRGVGQPVLGPVDAHHVDEHGAQRDVAGEVDAERLPLHVLDPFGERAPVPPELLLHRGVGHLLGVLHHQHVALAVVRQAGREAEAAVADGDGGAAVPAGAGAVGVPVDRGVVVGVGVDHARGDDSAFRVDLAGRGIVTEGSDLLDAAVRDADVGDVPGELGAVDDGSGL